MAGSVHFLWKVDIQGKTAGRSEGLSHNPYPHQEGGRTGVVVEAADE